MKKIFNSLRKNHKKLLKLSVIEIADVLNDLGEYFKKESVRKILLKNLPEISGFSNEMCEIGISVLSEILSKENILKRLNGEFEDYNYLDGFFQDKRVELKKLIKPHGIVFHIAPANVFLGIADSIVMAFITKNASLVKLSSRDTFFPLFFKDALNKVDKNGIVTSCLEFVNAGHDNDILSECCKNSDAILFWGGKEAEEYYKSITPNGIKFIANGPRYSIALIEEKAMDEADYDGLAKDIVFWEQQACSSPQVVFVLGDELKICSNLKKALQKKISKLSYGEISIDEKIEILKIREYHRMEALINGINWPSEFINKDFSLLPLINDGIKPSPLHRTVFIKKISSINEFLKITKEYTPFLQTLGLRIIADNKKKLSDKINTTGFSRVVPLGKMSEGLFGAPHDGHYLLHELIRYISIEDNASSALEDIIYFASKHSKYYKKIIKPGMKFKDIPFLDRETMLKIAPPKSNDILTSDIANGFYFCSGGSTGNPKYSFYTNEDFDTSTKLLADIYRSAGINKNDIVANLFIAGNLWTSFLVVNQALKNIGCINLPVGGNSRIQDMAEYIQRFKPNAIVGLPSIIIALAEYFYMNKITSSIRKILYGGEHFTDEAKKFLEKSLGATQIKSAGYAIVDSGPIGVQCEYLSGSLHHAISKYNYIEFIKEGKPVKDGEIGEIVVTNLFFFASSTISPMNSLTLEYFVK
jgi:phenylacetate-CoA ligase